MSGSTYMILWAVYGVGILIALYFLWQWTRWPRVWWLGALVRIMALVVLLTPAQQAENSEFYAPAWITMVFDELQHLGDGWFRAGINLMAATLAGLIVYFVVLVFSFIQRRCRLKKA